MFNIKERKKQEKRPPKQKDSPQSLAAKESKEKLKAKMTQEYEKCGVQNTECYLGLYT